MLRRRSVLCGCCGAAAALGFAPASGQPVRLGPFSPAELEAVRSFYEPSIQQLFTDDLVARLPPSMRAQLGQVRLAMPVELPGADPANVLNANSLAGDRQDNLPLRTVRWIAEYCGAAASFERRKCPNWSNALLVYDGLLAAQRPGSARPPGPLAAFGLDRSIYQDSFVDNVSGNLFSSILFFILAHELGHIAYGHSGGPALLADISQRHESEADAYALDIMALVRLPPLSLALLFGAMAMMEGNQSTHPMSGGRAQAAANRILARPGDFVDRFEKDPAAAAQRLKAVAYQVSQAMALADDRQIRAAIARNVSGVRWPPPTDLVAFACQP